jgi:hypothetical protein
MKLENQMLSSLRRTYKKFNIIISNVTKCSPKDKNISSYQKYLKTYHQNLIQMETKDDKHYQLAADFLASNIYKDKDYTEWNCEFQALTKNNNSYPSGLIQNKIKSIVTEPDLHMKILKSKCPNHLLISICAGVICLSYFIMFTFAVSAVCFYLDKISYSEFEYTFIHALVGLPCSLMSLYFSTFPMLSLLDYSVMNYRACKNLDYTIDNNIEKLQSIVKAVESSTTLSEVNNSDLTTDPSNVENSFIPKLSKENE